MHGNMDHGGRKRGRVRTYTVIERDSGKPVTKIRARSNRDAVQIAVLLANVSANKQVRVFQGGFGFDSGWVPKCEHQLKKDPVLGGDYCHKCFAHFG